jgi:hypothetical protein
MPPHGCCVIPPSMLSLPYSMKLDVNCCKVPVTSQEGTTCCTWEEKDETTGLL